MKTVCDKCPAGYRCPSTTTNTQIACQTGYYAIGGKFSCTACPPGSYCLDATG